MAENQKTENKLIIRPQDGPQTKLFESHADIVIFGGGAGGGKSYGLLLEPLRHLYNPKFDAVIFRRTIPEITNPGSLYDTACDLYIPLGAVPNQTDHSFLFPSGMSVKFSHLQHEQDKHNWQGSQVAYFGWDELCHFTETQFFYLLSRLRSDSGVDGYIRCTCNPDSDSWVAQFISWWIDEHGYPIPERSGVVRWFRRIDGRIIWSDNKDHEHCKSVTFIPSTVHDNKILLAKNPGYLASLEALPFVERQRLLGGNWKVRPAAGNYFKREWFDIIDAMPLSSLSIRYWDRASSKKKGSAFTAGVKMHATAAGQWIISDVIKFQERPLGVREAIQSAATHDGKDVAVGIEQDPGQAGDAEADDYTRLLAGYNVKLNKVNQDKITRAGPFSAQCEARNVKLMRGTWNKDFLDELESFPDSKLKDQVDASSGAFFMLTTNKTGEFSKQHTQAPRSKLVTNEDY